MRFGRDWYGTRWIGREVVLSRLEYVRMSCSVVKFEAPEMTVVGLFELHAGSGFSDRARQTFGPQPTHFDSR